jgi:phosphate transport system substrate-binding protein
MYPKPPVTRTGKSGWLGHQATRLKSLAVVGAVTLGFAGAAFAAAAPASADPGFQFVAVGSDTTQNVMDFFAGQTSGGIIGSYDAVNPSTQTLAEIITPGVAGSGGNQLNCSYTRPNGSGGGFKALDKSLNPSTTLGQAAVPPGPGCIQFSRSSGGPGTVAQTGPGALDANGALVYIPFALDAVTDATGPTTAIPVTTKCNGPTTPTGFTCSSTTGIGTVSYTTTPTKITTIGQATLANLQALYQCAPGTTAPNDFVTVGGVNYFPNGDAPTGVTGDVNIDLYVPQSGSGTLAFWETAMGLTSGLKTCDHQTVLAGPATGVTVEEHDGTAMASDPNGLAPISIAKWIAFSNGVVTPDVRFGDILQPLNGVQPITGGSLNGSFPITREVYNVLPFDQVVNTGDGHFNAVLAGLFAGSGSGLCQSTFTILNLGFGTLPAPNQPDACGATPTANRVQETNNGPS